MLLFSIADYFLRYSPVAAVVILAVVSLIAIVYALGTLLSNEQIKAWARIELTESFYSAVILVMALSIFALTDSSIAGVLDSPGVTGGTMCANVNVAYPGVACHIAVAKSFFSMVFEQSSYYLYTILREYSRFSYLSGMGVNTDSRTPAMGSVTFAPFAAYLHIPMSIYSYLFDFGIRSLILMKLQEILLVFISTAIFPVFFTVGVVLRAFPAMRKLGGLMMAIAVSFYYIYPAFYILGAIVFQGMINADIAEGGIGLVMTAPIINFESLHMPVDEMGGDPDLWNDWQGARRDEFSSGSLLQLGSDTNVCMPASENPDAFSAGEEWAKFLKLIWDLITLPFSGMLFGEQFDEWIFSDNGVINGVARMVFFSLFFSFLSIMATIAAIKSLSPILGGDVEIAGLTHLV